MMKLKIQPEKRKITCIVRDGNDPDRRIDAVGGWYIVDTIKKRWKLSLDDAICHANKADKFETGGISFYTVHQNTLRRVTVKTLDNLKHLATAPDDQILNNLSSLGDCPE